MATINGVGSSRELSTLTAAGQVAFNAEAALDETSTLAAVGRFPLDTPDQLGLLEGILAAIGEADNDIGGYRVTRLLDDVEAGGELFPVEGVIDWEQTGRVVVDGVLYAYGGRGDGTLQAITYVYNGETVRGAKQLHRRGAEVMDLGNPYNAIQRVRRALLVDYAEGDDLNAIGRNLGVNRYPFQFDDDDFREVIKALAYNPRGTIYGIELALDALVGEGNYTITEDLVAYPCTVFISLAAALFLGNLAFGHAYVGDPEDVLSEESVPASGNYDLVPLVASPVTGGVPRSVTWRPHEYDTDCRDQKPSADLYAEYDGAAPAQVWYYTGDDEGVDVVQIAGSHVQITALGGAGNEAGYMLGLRTDREFTLDWSFYCQFMVPAGYGLGGPGTMLGFWVVSDTAQAILIGLMDVDGSTYQLLDFITVTETLNRDQWYTLEIKRKGPQVSLLLDGRLLTQVNYADLGGAPFDPNDSFAGVQLNNGLPGDMRLNIRQLGFTGVCRRDYISYRAADAALTGDTLTSPTAAFTTDDTGKRVLTEGAVDNPTGGNNTGRWTIKTVDSALQVTLEAELHENAATLDTANDDRITVPQDREAFGFPEDLGRDLVLTGSALGQDGTYTILRLLHPDTLQDLVADFNTPIPMRTNVCEVEVSGGGAPSFVTEFGLDYRLTPSFVVEAAATFDLSGAADVVAGPKVQLRAALPGIVSAVQNIVRSAYSRVLTGQILGVSVPSVTGAPEAPSAYPFYITEPLGLLRAYLDDLTAAGVIPEYQKET